MIELYIHIPFCVRKCAYCDFLSGPADSGMRQAYLEALLAEIRQVSGPVHERVSSVYIGGGTPSLLEGRQIASLLDTLYQSFSITPDAEISMEANPGTLSLGKLQTYRKAGINRLSLGLQSAQKEELAVLGRIHSFEDFLESYAFARQVGFDNINVDLMFALPGQTIESWENSLRRVASMEPEHLSAYSLIVEEGTPFAGMDLQLPDEEEEYRMYDLTAEVLAEYGYQQYEISNYAKPGRACRHNAGYWQRTPYLGLGLGAASLWEETRFSNTRDLAQYISLQGDPAGIRQEEVHLTKEDRMGEYMFLGLRMTEGVSVSGFTKEFDIALEEVYREPVKRYTAWGLLKRTGDKLALTRQGIHVSNTVMADFLL